jgi:hypothetical protein
VSLAAVAEDSPVVFAAVPQLPDFSAAAVVPSPRYPLPGQPISVTVQLRNDGVPWGCSDFSCLPFWMSVEATWDGGPGLGEAAGRTRSRRPLGFLAGARANPKGLVDL